MLYESGTTVQLLAVLLVLLLVAVVAHGWMARRQVSLRGQLVERKAGYDRLRAEVAALAEEVGQCRHGITANALSVRNLEGEIAQLQVSVKASVREHPELAAEYENLTRQVGEEPPGKQA